ncbi:hypothetical protein AB0J80_27470 [Actinoplanes sp. NPDC049548]|uniref:hypothetical protein n=1 Tax=Actinoplanes sp. NPDC049548 TaxID=3155152 RepID=UPI00343B6C5B
MAVALVAFSAGVVLLWPHGESAAVAQHHPEASSPTPFEQAVKILDQQAAALLKGDEKGWIAPVDRSRPALVARYRRIFRNLRALDVSHAEYHAFPRQDGKPGAVTANAVFGYCFSGVVCPGWRDEFSEGPPKTAQLLTFELIKGRYVVTDMAAGMGAGGNHLQRAPWDGGDLVVARGERVTVAATRSQSKHVREVLTAAEKAVVVADHFAGYVGGSQRHHRIYLADEQAWDSWYGGGPDWAFGHALPLNAVGADVVLRAGEVLRTRRQLAFSIQHELGHVVTLSGLTDWETDHQWLAEGIADYIGAYPRKPETTGNRDVLAAEFRRRNAPTTIATKPLTGDADDRTVHRLYAMGHFAATCMADTYGERKLFAFTDRVLRRGDTLDTAARAAYGTSFDAVDKTCLKWIKQRVR